MSDDPSKISPLVRPTLLGTVAFVAFGVALVGGTIEGVFGNGFGLRFGAAVMAIMAKVPDNVTELFGLMFGVYGLGKSVERATQTHSRAKYEQPNQSPPRRRRDPIDPMGRID